MDRAPVSALKWSVSWESIDRPDGQPMIERRPPSSCTGDTSIVGNQRQRFGGGDHVIGVATVVCDAWHLGGNLTGDEITATTRITFWPSFPPDPFLHIAQAVR